MKATCSYICHGLPTTTTTTTPEKKDTYSSDEDNGFETLAEDGNQGENKHGIATRSVTEALLVLAVHGLGELDLPLLLDLGSTEHGHTHNGDHDHGNEGEHSDPDALTVGPQVVTILVPIRSNKACENKQKVNEWRCLLVYPSREGKNWR